MNAESTAVLQDMICETKREIQGGGNHPPPLVVRVTKNLGSLRVNIDYESSEPLKIPYIIYCPIY